MVIVLQSESRVKPTVLQSDIVTPVRQSRQSHSHDSHTVTPVTQSHSDTSDRDTQSHSDTRDRDTQSQVTHLTRPDKALLVIMSSAKKRMPVLVLSLTEAEILQKFDMEREAAKNLMEVIQANNKLDDLDLELDDLTAGDGNCMVTALIQQSRRHEVFPTLTAEMKNMVDGPITPDMTSQFRSTIKQFVIENQAAPAIQAIKGGLTGTWEEYWSKMSQNGEWGDELFLQCTAKLLQVDILVISRSSTQDMPFLLIAGSTEECVEPAGDSSETGDSSKFYLGFTGTTGRDNHYQSLLPRATRRDIFRPPVMDFGCAKSPKLSREEQKREADRVRVRASRKVRKAKQSEGEKAALKRENERKRKAKSRAAQKSADPDLLKENDKKFQAKSRAAKKSADPEVYKAQHNESVANYRAAQRDNDEINLKRKQNEEKDKSLQAQRQKDYKKTKTDQNNSQSQIRAKRKAQHGTDRPGRGLPAAKRKKVENANDRLRNFRLATMTGQDFICVSCHGRCFKHSVVKLTEDLEKKLDSNFENPDAWIPDRDVKSNITIEWVNLKVPAEYKNSNDYSGVAQRYVCKKCLTDLRKKKLPSCSVMNGLRLHETDKELKEQNLMLTDLEAAMVSPVIIFNMITLLPKSRWSSLHNQSVLVPIDPDKINQTLGKMPRTPSEAGLVPIKLKRKEAYANDHCSQLVNPSKLFKFVQKMNDNGNPFYQDVGVAGADDIDTALEEFKEKCKNTDKRGYKVVYGDEDDDSSDDNDDDDDEAKEETEQAKADRKMEELRQKEEFEDEQEYRKNDPVKKFQLVYDETVALIDNCPDLEPTIVAPGEGARPVNPLHEKNWDVRSFPHLFNPDGSGGFDDDSRPKKIRLQSFLKQRLCNKDSRFASCQPYLYSAVSHLEARRISSNIGLVGRRGKESKVNGETEYKLEDAFLVTANVPNGPAYQRRLKQDILARLDSEGGFQFFFTLSCADLRWDPVFASILADRGYSINFKVESVDGVTEVTVEARTKDGKWKPIKDFIKEDVDESYHELIRGNVGTATRYFDHKLKQFISKVVMATSNLMSVSSYTWRIEFQGESE